MRQHNKYELNGITVDGFTRLRAEVGQGPLDGLQLTTAVQNFLLQLEDFFVSSSRLLLLSPFRITQVITFPFQRFL
jgi:hypothetical protein